MPLVKFEENGGNPWAVWRIDETNEPASPGSVPADITHPRKQLEWSAGRRLAKHLMSTIGLEYQGITKNRYGKPHLIGHPEQLSLSHSYPYVACYLHGTHSVGIDLEQPREKLRHIAARVFTEQELGEASGDLTRLCVIWCAKEALVKVHGKKDLVFRKNLAISAFSAEKQGHFVGSIIANDQVQNLMLYFEVHPDFVLVLNKP